MEQKSVMIHVPNGQSDHKHAGGMPLSHQNHEHDTFANTFPASY